MARFTKFSISNFKGIKQTSIDFMPNIPGNIITLIGLNESGKTTILEAIANYFTIDKDTLSLIETVQASQSHDKLVPKSLSGIFTGSIRIDARIEFDEEEIGVAVKAVREKFKINIIEPKSSLAVVRSISFKDGNKESGAGQLWGVRLKGVKVSGKKKFDISTKNEHKQTWHLYVDTLEKMLPKILYFPTFLFDFPNKIYLSDSPPYPEGSKEWVINAYYRQMIYDVASTVEPGDAGSQKVSIDTHIVQRLKNKESGYEIKLQSVLNIISDKMRNKVLSEWSKIFGKTSNSMRIAIESGVEDDEARTPWIRIYLSDGPSTYHLDDRSLGFRWFFSFILFTSFRKSRGEKNTIFLFDEPAANLHSLAQMQLIKLFSNIASDGNTVIYSTHSHYLINPNWLEKAYIIKNSAAEHDEELSLSAIALDTDIKAINYRRFSFQNPTRSSYFQPVLDALKFNLGPMVPGKRALVVEGKFDFHPLRYFLSKLDLEEAFGIFPAGGAADGGVLISLFRGWGVNYVILLDDDKGGKEAGAKYRRDAKVPDNRIIKISEALPVLSGQAFEGLYSDSVKTLAQSHLKGAHLKQAYFFLFMEYLAKKDYSADLGETDTLVADLINFISGRLDAIQEGPL